MAISIDGKRHRENLKVKYGHEFPKPYRSIEIEHPVYGDCLIYITQIGIPKWNSDYTVSVPIEYYLTQITKPSDKYQKEKRKKKIGLQLVKE